MQNILVLFYCKLLCNAQNTSMLSSLNKINSFPFFFLSLVTTILEITPRFWKKLTNWVDQLDKLFKCDLLILSLSKISEHLSSIVTTFKANCPDKYILNKVE